MHQKYIKRQKPMVVDDWKCLARMLQLHTYSHNTDMGAFMYGWGVTNDLKDPFWVRFSACERKPSDWKKEIRAAVRSIVNDAGARPIWLCFSGGINSEIMCQNFFDEGINFSVLTVKHLGNTNQHDYVYAERWCRTHDVRQEFVELDMEKFMLEESKLYIRDEYVSGNIFRYFQIHLLEIIESKGGYAVLGGGAQLYRADGGDAYLNFDVGYAVPLEWCRRNNTTHQPYFYFETPELCLSYLDIPIVDFAVQHPNIFRHPNNAFVFKRLVMQSMFPSLEKRTKFNGFENVLPIRKESEALLATAFGPLIQQYRLPVASFRQQLSGALDT